MALPLEGAAGHRGLPGARGLLLQLRLRLLVRLLLRRLLWLLLLRGLRIGAPGNPSASGPVVAVPPVTVVLVVREPVPVGVGDELGVGAVVSVV
ncbi:hypothetical protein DQ226_03445 [Dietzia maris]|uniref:Uncharacterized protein n=1 Tax=Dietzia maris TaxID=37915 RepID=A0A365PCW4_9ACTN|nr:hypothetical protein DQ226_03445 [Dietzia maris]